jgi:hypothetical protein
MTRTALSANVEKRALIAWTRFHVSSAHIQTMYEKNLQQHTTLKLLFSAVTFRHPVHSQLPRKK